MTNPLLMVGGQVRKETLKRHIPDSKAAFSPLPILANTSSTSKVIVQILFSLNGEDFGERGNPVFQEKDMAFKPHDASRYDKPRRGWRCSCRRPYALLGKSPQSRHEEWGAGGEQSGYLRMCGTSVRQPAPPPQLWAGDPEITGCTIVTWEIPFKRWMWGWLHGQCMCSRSEQGVGGSAGRCGPLINHVTPHQSSFSPVFFLIGLFLTSLLSHSTTNCLFRRKDLPTIVPLAWNPALHHL